jgi:hypothetical protein
MTRHMALCLLMGALAFAACDGAPAAPTPLSPPPGAPPITPAPVLPTPPPTSPGNSSLTGSYTMTLDIGSGCDVMPAAERTRTYTATIEHNGERNVVTLSDGSFLSGPICTAGSRHFSGMGCQQFFATEDAYSTVRFFLENNNDEAHGGHIVEQLSSGRWVEIIGHAAGTLDPFDRSSIEASGEGSVWYCRTPSDYPFPCADFTSCRSNDMRLTFRRQSE